MFVSRKIINLYGQRRNGPLEDHLKVGGSDEMDVDRQKWFNQAIHDMEAKLSQRNEKRKTVPQRRIAFPKGIGCDFAEENWPSYHAEIVKLAKRQPKWYIDIYD